MKLADALAKEYGEEFPAAESAIPNQVQAVDFELCVDEIFSSLKSKWKNSPTYEASYLEHTLLRALYSLNQTDPDKVAEGFASLINDESYFIDSKEGYFMSQLNAAYFSGRYDDGLKLIKNLDLSSVHPFFLQTLVRNVCASLDHGAVEYLINVGVRADLEDENSGHSLLKFGLKHNLKLALLAIDQGIDACSEKNLKTILRSGLEYVIPVLQHLIKSASLHFRNHAALKELVNRDPRVLALASDVLNEEQVSFLIKEAYTKGRPYEFWYLVDRFTEIARYSIRDAIPNFNEFNERNAFRYIMFAKICKKYGLEINYSLYALKLISGLADGNVFQDMQHKERIYYEAFSSESAVFNYCLTEIGVVPLFECACKHRLVSTFFKALKKFDKIELINAISDNDSILNEHIYEIGIDLLNHAEHTVKANPGGLIKAIFLND